MLTAARLLMTLLTCAQLALCSVSNSTTDESETDGTRVAVIGAGAGGSAFSYYLQRYTDFHFNITVFESSGYIGGRSTTIGNYAKSLGNITDEALLESIVELGGAAFIETNYIMAQAMETFNLSVSNPPMDNYPEIFTSSIGVWDGSKFTMTVDDSSILSTIMSNIVMIIKYNFSMFKLEIDLNSVLGNFIGYFYQAAFPFDLETIVPESGLSKYTGTQARSWMSKNLYTTKFLDDLGEPLTRVNYRSNLDEIHTFGAFISEAATSGAVAVEGGNYLIFENFLEASDATLLLNTPVSKISLNSDGTYDVTYNNNEVATFDQVIIAAPFQFTNIEIEGLEVDLKSVEYRTLYASYIETASDHMIDNSKLGTNVPEELLTTGSDAPFFSINIVDYDESSDRVRYKIFTEGGIDEQFLSDYLFDDITDVDIWFQKEWHPYPILEPTTEFDGFEVNEGLWYLNSMERFISTMETSCLAGASVAGHIAMANNFTEGIVVP